MKNPILCLLFLTQTGIVKLLFNLLIWIYYYISNYHNILALPRTIFTVTIIIFCLQDEYFIIDILSLALWESLILITGESKLMLNVKTGESKQQPFLKCYNAISGNSWMECSNKNAFQTCFSKYNHSEPWAIRLNLTNVKLAKHQMIFPQHYA